MIRVLMNGPDKIDLVGLGRGLWLQPTKVACTSCTQVFLDFTAQRILSLRVLRERELDR